MAWRVLTCSASVAALLIAGALPAGSVRAAEAPPYYQPEEPAPEIAPPGRGPTETVLARPRPDFDPVGIKFGGFRLFPEAIVSGGYDSNIYRTDRNTESDLISVVRPRVQMRSDFNQHRLDMSAEAAAGFYADHDDENFFDYRGDVRGQIDILRGLRFEAALTGEHGHEDRASVDFGSGTEPTQFDRYSMVGVLAARSGRFRYRAGLGVTRFNFDDVPAVGGGTVNNDDRDHTQIDTFGRVSFELNPSFRLFLSGRLNSNDFDAAVDDSGVDRDSSGLLATTGVEYDGGGIWFARAFVGWREQSYTSASLDDVSGGTVGAQVTGNITPLTTLTATVDRDIIDTGTVGASSYWDTGGDLRVDHELLRNLIVSGAVRARLLDFNGISRSDELFGGGVGLRWLMSRNMWVTLDYDIDQRNSSGLVATNDFLDNRFFVRLVLQP
jgi:hypothetical protein